LRVLDQCRRTLARVLAVDGETVTTLATPLLFKDRELRLGRPAPRGARWRDGGLAFVRAPVPGDPVSLHWDFVSDLLTPSAARAFDLATRRAISAVNRPTPI
jgi:hypothetical protein